MTNYDYLITLPPADFNRAIISAVSECGGNEELLLRYLNSEYVSIKTVRDILLSNYSGVNITFRYRGFIYGATSVEDFLKQYGAVSEWILSLRVQSIRTGRNGNKTVVVL